MEKLIGVAVTAAVCLSTIEGIAEAQNGFGGRTQLENLSGVYASPAPEPWYGGFGTRKFSFNDGQWSLVFTHALDAKMEAPTFRFRTAGPYRVDAASAAVPGAFVVNLGDMLDRMTGGRYRSTPHRVRHARGASRDRLSFPFFFDPGWDVEVAPIPLPDDTPPDDQATRWDGTSVHDWSGTYGDYLTAKVAKVFPHLVPILDGKTGEAPG